MVHGLETIIRLNEEAILKTGKRKHRKRSQGQGPLYWYPKGHYSSRRSSEMIPTIEYWPQLFSTGRLNIPEHVSDQSANYKHMYRPLDN